MTKKRTINDLVNILNLVVSILVFGSGLILLLQFHMGNGSYQSEWHGVRKEYWLSIHQITAICFLIGFIVHIILYWKYIKSVSKKWYCKLSPKIKSKTKKQILMFIIALVVMSTGFSPWIFMPGATLKNKTFHSFIDIHHIIGNTFLIGIIVHITKRWHKILCSIKGILQVKLVRKNQKHSIKKNFIKTSRNCTKYIYLDKHKCVACWECIGQCKFNTLEKVDLWFHKHVVIKFPERCTGCKNCIKVCSNGAFEFIMKIQTIVTN